MLEIRTRDLAIGSAILLIAILIPGMVYWFYSKAHFVQCIFGNAECSLTVSTYLLCFLTMLAFLAAYRAARYAYQTFEIEQKVVLAIERHPIDTKRLGCQNAQRTEERYMESIAEGFTSSQPQNYTSSQYPCIDFDCMSVGRSPIVNGVICIKSYSQNNRENKNEIEIGSIPAGEFIHLRLRINKPISARKFQWVDGEMKHGKGIDIEFHARESLFIFPSIIRTPRSRSKPSSPSIVTLDE